MKTLYLISMLFLSLMIVGCGQPNGDFCNDRAKIIEKHQTEIDKEKKQAKYTISFDSGNYMNYNFIMPENFGEVGNVIHTTNRMWYASPIKLENER